MTAPYDLTWCIAQETGGRCLYDARVLSLEEREGVVLLLVERVGWESYATGEGPLPRYRSRVSFRDYTSWKTVSDWRKTPRKKRPPRPGPLWEIQRVQRFAYGLVLECGDGPDLLVYGAEVRLEIEDLERCEPSPSQRLLISTEGEIL
jgi:hypothetical protein